MIHTLSLDNTGRLYLRDLKTSAASEVWAARKRHNVVQTPILSDERERRDDKTFIDERHCFDVSEYVGSQVLLKYRFPRNRKRTEHVVQAIFSVILKR